MSKDADVAALEAALADPQALAEEADLGRRRELGKDLVNYLFMALRTMQIHALDNDAVGEPLRRMEATLDALLDDLDSAEALNVEGQMYLNDLRLRFPAAAYSNVQFITNLMSRHGVGGFVFGEKLDLAQLRSLMQVLLNKVPPKGPEAQPLTELREAVRELELPGVRLEAPYTFKPAGFEEAEREDRDPVTSLYAAALVTMQQHAAGLQESGRVQALALRKVVHPMVDLCTQEPELFLRMHSITGLAEPWVEHAVNTAILSIAMGRLLSLARPQLAELGLAAMLHDVGRLELDRHQAPAPSHSHPIAGVRAMLRQSEYGPGAMHRMRSALEHHIHPGGGFPPLHVHRLTLFTRVVQVAEFYLAAVHPAGGARPGAEALELLQGATGTLCPATSGLLVRLLGRWPLGSVVRLSDGQLAVVVSGGRDARRFADPRVVLADGSTRDLALDAARIVEGLPPGALGKPAHQVLLAADPHPDEALAPGLSQGG